MKTYHVVHYAINPSPSGFQEFEDAMGHALRRYSMRDFLLAGTVTEVHFVEALQKALQVCSLAGIDSRIHFKKVYIFDADTGELYADWLMSKKGFKLLVMQCPSLNEQIARWLWKLSE